MEINTEVQLSYPHRAAIKLKCEPHKCVKAAVTGEVEDLVQLSLVKKEGKWKIKTAEQNQIRQY